MATPETLHGIEGKHGIIKNIIGSQFSALQIAGVNGRMTISTQAYMGEAGCLSSALIPAQATHAYQR